MQEWSVKFDDDHIVRLAEMSPDVFETIAAGDNSASWLGVYRIPFGNPKRMYGVIKAAAEWVGIDVPEMPTNMADADKLVDMFIEDKGDRPKVGTNTETPSSNTEGGAETTS